MSALVVILAALALMGAIAAVSQRNLVHCVLSVLVSFSGLAGLFLTLGAPLLGLAQVLVYVGAVGILVVFALLLTRGGGTETGSLFSGAPLLGWAVSGLVLGSLLLVLLLSGPAGPDQVRAGEAQMREIGWSLMTDGILPLQVAGLLLTAALIGAAVLAMTDRRGEGS